MKLANSILIVRKKATSNENKLQIDLFFKGQCVKGDSKKEVMTGMEDNGRATALMGAGRRGRGQSAAVGR